MKTNQIKYITLMVLSFLAFSCQESLDLAPLDRVSNETFWKQSTEYKLAANKFYDYLRSFSNGNGDGHGGSDLGADRGTFARGTNTIVSNDNNYNDAYRWIRDINTLLQNAETYAKPDEIKTYVAEAKFFRGYVYFDKLFMNYGGVILVKDVLSPSSPELTAARASRDETFDFIISDLEAAIPNLPSETSIGATDKGRISKEAAQAFLGRVCLYEGTWQKFHPNGNATRANAFLDKSIVNSQVVIDSKIFELFKPAALGDSALKYMFILENQKSNPANITKAANKEYIMASRYESANLLRTIPGQISFGALGADVSKVMADMYLTSDGLPIGNPNNTQAFSRAKMNSEFKARDNRMRYFMCVPGYRYWQNAVNYHINWNWSAADLANARLPHDSWANGISGYENQQWAAERQVPNFQEGYDYPTLRLAEVYLNYAEAVYERNGSISDADLDKSLNLVRLRVNANMPKLSNAFVTANGLNMRVEIRRERAVELQGEGFRMDDLKRWYIAHIELTKQVLGVLWKGTEFETKYAGKTPALDVDGYVIVDALKERLFTEKNYLLPMPTNQQQLNPNLAQNPGW